MADDSTEEYHFLCMVERHGRLDQLRMIARLHEMRARRAATQVGSASQNSVASAPRVVPDLISASASVTAPRIATNLQLRDGGPSTEVSESPEPGYTTKSTYTPEQLATAIQLQAEHGGSGAVRPRKSTPPVRPASQASRSSAKSHHKSSASTSTSASTSPTATRSMKAIGKQPVRHPSVSSGASVSQPRITFKSDPKTLGLGNKPAQADPAPQTAIEATKTAEKHTAQPVNLPAFVEATSSAAKSQSTGQLSAKGQKVVDSHVHPLQTARQPASVTATSSTARPKSMVQSTTETIDAAQPANTQASSQVTPVTFQSNSTPQPAIEASKTAENHIAQSVNYPVIQNEAWRSRFAGLLSRTTSESTVQSTTEAIETMEPANIQALSIATPITVQPKSTLQTTNEAIKAAELRTVQSKSETTTKAPKPMPAPAPSIATSSVGQNQVKSHLDQDIQSAIDDAVFTALDPLLQRLINLEIKIEKHFYLGKTGDTNAPFTLRVQYADRTIENIQARATMRVNEFIERCLLKKNINCCSKATLKHKDQALPHLSFVGEHDLSHDPLLSLSTDQE